MALDRDKVINILPELKQLDELYNAGQLPAKLAPAYLKARKLVSPWVGTGNDGQEVVYQFPRTPGDAIDQQNERSLISGDTEYGDPLANRRDIGGWGNTAVGVVKGIGDLVGIPGSMQELKERFVGPGGIPIAPGPVNELLKSQIASWTEGDTMRTPSGKTAKKVSAVIPGAPMILGMAEDITAPIRATGITGHGRPPTKEETERAARSGVGASVMLSGLSPTVQKATSATVKNVQTKHIAKRVAKGEKVYNELAPRAINTRLAPYLDKVEFEKRLARGENVGKKVHETWGYDLPEDPAVVRTEMDAQNTRTQERLNAHDMQFTVPENMTINSVFRETMKRMESAVGDDLNAHPKLREIIERTKQNGELDMADYTTLQDMATGKYGKEPAVPGKKAKKPAKVNMPLELRRTLGYIERLRREHGGTLELSPAQLNEAKSARYNQIKDESFSKDVTEVDKSDNAIKRGQARGLRKIVEEVTSGPDGSPITDMNLAYGELATFEKALKQRILARDTTPPAGGTVMSPAQKYSIGAGLGGVTGLALGIDPMLGVAAGTAMTPMGASAVRSMNDFWRSPRTGAKIASARKAFAVKPPDKPVKAGPAGPPTGGSHGVPRISVAPPNVPPTAPPPPQPQPAQKPKSAPKPAPAAEAAGISKAKEAMRLGSENNLKDLKTLWAEHAQTVKDSGELSPGKLAWLEQRVAMQDKIANKPKTDVVPVDDTPKVRAKHRTSDAQKKKATARAAAAPPTAAKPIKPSPEKVQAMIDATNAALDQPIRPVAKPAEQPAAPAKPTVAPAEERPVLPELEALSDVELQKKFDTQTADRSNATNERIIQIMDKSLADIGAEQTRRAANPKVSPVEPATIGNKPAQKTVVVDESPAQKAPGGVVTDRTKQLETQMVAVRKKLAKLEDADDFGSDYDLQTEKYTKLAAEHAALATPKAATPDVAPAVPDKAALITQLEDSAKRIEKLHADGDVDGALKAAAEVTELLKGVKGDTTAAPAKPRRPPKSPPTIVRSKLEKELSLVSADITELKQRGEMSSVGSLQNHLNKLKEQLAKLSE